MSEFEPKQQSASYAEKLQEKPEAGTGRKSMIVLAACAVLAVLSLVYLTINVATNSITLSVNKRAVEQLSESILNKQTAFEDLQSSIDLKREKDREFDTAILRKKNERKGLEVELDRANKILAAEEEARASLANVHDGLALSRKKWDDVKKAVRDLENKKILLDGQLPKLSEDVAKLDSQLKLSRKNLSNSDLNLEKSRQALDKQRQNISALKVEIGREHGNLNATKNQIDSERDQLEGLRAKQKALKVSIDTDRQKAAVATAEANEAVRKLNSKNNQIVLLEREMELLAAVNDRQSTDQANLTVVRQSLTEVKQELQKKSAELRTARDSLMQQRTERAELTETIGSLKGQKGVLVQEISGLNADQTNLSGMLPSLTEVKQELQKKSAELRTARDSLMQQRTERAELTETIGSLKGKKAELVQEISGLNADQTNLSGMLPSLTEVKQELQKKSTELRTARDSLMQQRTERAELTETIGSLKGKKAELVQEISGLNADQTNLSGMLPSLTEVKQELQKKSTELRTARDSLMQQRTERAELTEIIGSLRGQKGVLIQEISGLNSDRKQLSNVDADLNESRQMLNNRNRDIEAAELALGQAKSKESDSRNQYETLSAKIAELKSTRTSYEASVIAVENQLNKLDKRKKDVITEIALQHAELLSFKDDMIRLKEDAASSQGSIEGLKKRAAQLREEIKILKDAAK